MEDFIKNLMNKVKYTYPRHSVHHRLRVFFTFKNIFNKKNYKNKNLLDVGCGRGLYDLLFSKKGFLVDAFDKKDLKEAVDRAKKYNLKINYFLMDAENISLNKKYDVIFCSEVIEHLDDYNKIINNFKNIIKENGSIIISMPNAFSINFFLKLIKDLIKNKLIFSEVDNHCKFPFWRVKKIFKDSGFKIRILGSVYFLPLKIMKKIGLNLSDFFIFKYIGAFCFYEVKLNEN